MKTDVYKKFRNKVVHENRQAKKDYYNKYFVKHKDNMKMLWTGIRSVINMKHSGADSIISHLVYNGSEINDSKKMANIFNEFFVNISSKINEKIPRTKKLALDYLHSNIDSSFFISPVTTLEIVDIISSLKNGKAAGPFSIPINLLKILSNLIAEPLCTIVNGSFSTGIFSDDLKLAKSYLYIKKVQLMIQQTTDLYPCCQSLVRSLKNLCIKDCINSLK